MEKGGEVYIFAVELRKSSAFSNVSLPGHSLIHHDTDGIVEDAFPEYDRVELGIHFVGIEDGKDGDWICSRESRPEDKTFEESEF